MNELLPKLTAYPGVSSPFALPLGELFVRVPNAVKSDVRSLAVRPIVGQRTEASGACSRESEVSVDEISATTTTVHRGKAASHWTPAAA